VTTAHANGDRNDATHRFDRLARGLRISDQLSGLNDMDPFPPHANVFHLSQDGMNLGSAHAYDNRNDASFFRPSRRPRTSEDQLTGANEPIPQYANVYQLSQDDMNFGIAHSYDDGNKATSRFLRPGPRIYADQRPGFNDMKLDTLDEQNALHGSQSGEHATTRPTRRVKSAVVFGDCIFSVDPSGLLTRGGSCPTQSEGLSLSGMSIKALAPDVFSNLSSVR
jgi:hypothetical protein